MAKLWPAEGDMIPSTLHVIWIGPKRMTALNRKCAASMIEHLPAGWKFVIHGNEEADAIPWVKRAIEKGVYGMASDYMRAHILFNEGGIYLDADVEVLKPLDFDAACFIGFQRDDSEDDCVNTAVMGGIAGHWFFKRLLERYGEMEPCGSQVFACTVPTQELRKRGMKGVNVAQTVDGVQVLTRDYFHPIRWDDKSVDARSDATYAVHHFQNQWI